LSQQARVKLEIIGLSEEKIFMLVLKRYDKKRARKGKIIYTHKPFFRNQ